jgi:hypothetical protein
MANRVPRPLKVIAFNEKGTSNQRSELSKQLQDLHIDVATIGRAAYFFSVNLRPTISRPACPVVSGPSGTCDQFFFLL